jgi:hypothetical protein
MKDLEKQQASQGNRKQQNWQMDSPTADKGKALKTCKRKRRQKQKEK